MHYAEATSQSEGSFQCCVHVLGPGRLAPGWEKRSPPHRFSPGVGLVCCRRRRRPRDLKTEQLKTPDVHCLPVSVGRAWLGGSGRNLWALHPPRPCPGWAARWAGALPPTGQGCGFALPSGHTPDTTVNASLSGTTNGCFSLTSQ